MFRRYLFIILSLMLLPAWASAQSITGANFNGTVTDTDGEPLPGATVIAIHEPSGTEYGTTTRADGRFNIRNARIGGPYTVRVSFVGFRSAERSDIQLELAQDYSIDISLVDETLDLGEVSVTAQRDAVISGDRSGARSRISRNQLDVLPSINRSLQDYTRLSPQVSGSNIAGRSGRRNAIQIDGVTFDDRFGLGSDAIPTIGNPISIDAIEEFQVEISPFDVTQGNFTGGAVNAVTRSGTNEFTGSVYGFGRNQNFISEQLAGEESPINDFSEYQVGARLGGPIVENKLFFFVNAEVKRENSPLLTFGETNFNGSESDLQEIIDISQGEYGYNPGGFGDLSQRTDDWKIFTKLDWNINSDHRLTYQQNLVNGYDDRGISRGNFSYSLANRQYRQRGNQSNFSVLLNSSWADNLTSEAKVAYTRLRQEADFGDSAFPSVSVQTPSGGSVNFGVERFRHANELDQDYLELTANVSYFVGAHSFTFGTNNYLNQFRNLFIQDALGTYTFQNQFDNDGNLIESGIDRFERGAPTRYQYSYSTDVDEFGNRPEANWGYNTFALYAQDEWSANDNLTLTLGVRADLTVFPDDPPSNQTFSQDFPGFDTGNVPDPTLQFNPRFGFNWNNGETQLRGGVGLFSGGEPGVWLSNQYSNTGVDLARLDVRRDFDDGFFSGDVNSQPLPGDGSGLDPIETTEVNLTDPDFKINQIFRTNLAVEQRLPWNLVGTVEFLYSNNLQDVNYQNINLPGANQDVQISDGRPFFGEVTFDDNGDPVYSQRRVSDNFTDVLLLTNTDKGYQWSLTTQLRKEFSDGWFADLSYTYANGKSVNDGTSSRAISNWQFNEVPGDPNDAPAARSVHITPHRFLASASYQLNYGSRYATTFSLIYEGRQGGPLTFAYFTQPDPSINGDYRGANDLVYVPENESDVILRDTEWEDLNRYIEDNDALRENRGQIVPRGEGNQPWVNEIDFRITQNIQTIGGQSLEISLDILNFGNLIGTAIGQDTWGVERFASNSVTTELTFEGFEATEQTDGSVDLQPIVSFDPDRVPSNIDQFTVSNTNSRWRAQLGLRYSF
ncbi:MAG: carboxypeptidase regulatory-like domain-containing protein [Balneolaceae bacterium]